MKKLIFIICISAFSVSADAAVYFTPSLFYMKYEQKQGTTGETELSIYNFKLGTTLASGLYLGAVYDMESIDDDDRTSLGLGVGFIKNEWNFHFTYFVTSEKDSGTSEYTGTGMNFEIGYLFKVGSWSVGPTLTYRMFTYDEVNDVSLNPELEENRFLPYVSFQFMF